MPEMTHDELKEHAKALDASNLQNQTALDAALQKHKDDAAAFNEALKAKDVKHAADVAELQTQLAKLASDAEAALKATDADHKKIVATLNALHETAMANQASQLAAQHAEAVAKLKQDFLLPALKDLQARRAADLAAQHKSEMDALLK